MKENPNAEEFARTVLKNLAALRAEVREVKLLLADALHDLRHLPTDQIRHHYDESVQAETNRLYKESLKGTNLQKPRRSPASLPFRGRGANPTK